MYFHPKLDSTSANNSISRIQTKKIVNETIFFKSEKKSIDFLVAKFGTKIDCKLPKYAKNMSVTD